MEYENPKKTSNIFKAVKNHFAASGQVNPKRNPRIGNFCIYISSQSLKSDDIKTFFLLFQFLVNALRMFFQRRSLNESENHLKNPEPLPLLNPFSMTLPNRMMPTGNFKPKTKNDALYAEGTKCRYELAPSANLCHVHGFHRALFAAKWPTDNWTNWKFTLNIF